MSTTILPPPLADFCGVIAESKRIINAHSRHFLALSVLFLLPLSFSLAAFPTLYRTFNSSSSNDHNRSVRTLLRLNSFLPEHDNQILHHYFTHIHLSNHTIAFAFPYLAFIILLFISAAGSITYSIYHGFYGRPVKLSLALRSLARSYLRILATLLVSLVTILLVCAVFTLFELLAYKLVQVLTRSDSPLDSPYFLGVSSFAAVILLCSLTKLAANWVLVGPITVIECRWGIDCLTRSRNLVRRMRWTAIPLISFFGLSAALVLLLVILTSSSSTTCVGGGGGGGVTSTSTRDFIISSTCVGGGGNWRRWAFVAQLVVTSAMFTIILLHGLASSTVLYMYCKAVQGELAEEIAKEFRREYVSLPFDDQDDNDDDKVPHLVSVVANQ